MESPNSATAQQALAEDMIQLGTWLVAMPADNYNPEHPFYFAKLSIKDGLWRTAIKNTNTWNFCFILPQLKPTTSINAALLVAPNCLQMDWHESPPFFCAASETARDVIEALLKESSLPQQPFLPYADKGYPFP